MKELCAATTSFENLIKAGKRLCEKGGRLEYLLCLFYSMWSAFVIRELWRTYDKDQARRNVVSKRADSVAQEYLPELAVVQQAVKKFAEAASLGDKVEMGHRLEEMGVFALCPNPEQEEQLARMEAVADSVPGRRRLVFLVDLSLLAVELGDYERAGKYSAEARSLNPTSWELYNLCIVEGQIALSCGNRQRAMQCVEESISACQRDEYTLISCGARAPNFALVEKLLDCGERTAVVKHLLESKAIWVFLQSHLDRWISVIEAGGAPDFRMVRPSKVANFSYRLKMQWMRVYSVEQEQPTTDLKPLAEGLAARERLREEYRRHIGAFFGKRRNENL